MLTPVIHVTALFLKPKKITRIARSDSHFMNERGNVRVKVNEEEGIRKAILGEITIFGKKFQQ